MHDPKRDPFFEGLKADLLDGLGSLDRGERVPLDEAIAHAHAAIDEVAKRRASERYKCYRTLLTPVIFSL